MTDRDAPSNGQPFNVADHADRVRRVAVNFGGRARTLGPFERVLWAIVAAIAFIFTLVLLIPFLLLGVIASVVVLLVVALRRAFPGSGRTGPRDEGRENVRVIRRE